MSFEMSFNNTLVNQFNAFTARKERSYVKLEELNEKLKTCLEILAEKISIDTNSLIDAVEYFKNRSFIEVNSFTIRTTEFGEYRNHSECLTSATAQLYNESINNIDDFKAYCEQLEVDAMEHVFYHLHSLNRDELYLAIDSFNNVKTVEREIAHCDRYIKRLRRIIFQFKRNIKSAFRRIIRIIFKNMDDNSGSDVKSAAMKTVNAELIKLKKIILYGSEKTNFRMFGRINKVPIIGIFPG